MTTFGMHNASFITYALNDSMQILSTDLCDIFGACYGSRRLSRINDGRGVTYIHYVNSETMSVYFTRCCSLFASYYPIIVHLEHFETFVKLTVRIFLLFIINEKSFCI